MSQTYWDAVDTGPARLAESLALLVTPLAPVTIRITPAEPVPAPDVSDVEIDESGLDFLTEYRAGLPVIVPEPNPEPVEVPEPVPADVVVQIDEPTVQEPAALNDWSEVDAELERAATDNEARSEDEPKVIYVRDADPHQSTSSVTPVGQSATDTTSASGTAISPSQIPTAAIPSTAITTSTGEAVESTSKEPARVLPPLSPIAIPVGLSGGGGAGIAASPVPASQGPVILPPTLPEPTEQANVLTDNATIYAKTAKIAGLENFDPTRYLDFDDRTDDGTEENDSEETSEKSRTRRVLADFGAGKRITQTENPAQAMQVLRELTVFRD